MARVIHHAKRPPKPARSSIPVDDEGVPAQPATPESERDPQNPNEHKDE